MSVLSDQFTRLRRAVPESQHAGIQLSVLPEGKGYRATCYIGPKASHGNGPTPEEALRDAVGASIQLRSRG